MFTLKQIKEGARELFDKAIEKENKRISTIVGTGVTISTDFYLKQLDDLVDDAVRLSLKQTQLKELNDFFDDKELMNTLKGMFGEKVVAGFSGYKGYKSAVMIQNEIFQKFLND